MTEPGSGRDVVVAAALMRMALALLDRAGEGLAGARLQHAIDTLDCRPRTEPAEAEGG